ncbi:MAG: hypothetical protein H6695_05935 [Deferribacteres bacterium]|nr:hypothetical protein [candidate division KSB1 bacterium]MCA9744605.1 hypothetical protein [candidate division KSB1 bacterium]MCB9509701.1 hypothetical protein [Deferribacteres bacterium]
MLNNSSSTWLSNLSKSKRVLIDSSTQTIQKIEQLQKKRNAKGFTGSFKKPFAIPKFNPSTFVEIKPIDLLHSIGLATTPPIPNLVDLSSTWALIRYIWAFNPDIDNLAVSQIAKNIDFHQKGVLSDEIGIGMAYWLMKRFFGAKKSIDVDIAIRNHGFAEATGFPSARKNGNSSPDYIFQLSDGNYSIVECKGGQSGLNQTRNQLRRGLEQVSSISFKGGQSATEFVIGTCLSDISTNVIIVDPPSEGNGDEREFSNEKKVYHVLDKEKFDREYQNLRIASLLSYAGAEGIAAEISKIESTEKLVTDFERRKPPHSLPLEEVNLNFQGRRLVLPGPSENEMISVFMGIEDNLLNEIKPDDSNIPDAARNDFASSFRKLFSESEPYYTFISESLGAVISICDEGTVLAISSQGQFETIVA